MNRPKVKFEERHGDRYVFWRASVGDQTVGWFGYSYLPSNNGSAFARNYSSSSVDATVSIVTDLKTLEGYTILKADVGPAKLLKNADKYARKWFREVDARGLLRDHAERMLKIETEGESK